MSTASGTLPIKLVIAEDSPLTRSFLVQICESDPRIRVVAAVGDGEAALEAVARCRPDVVLMDIHMPRLDGFEATRRIMESRPVPIVMCSATTDVNDVVTVFRAMEAGAVACIDKPGGPQHHEHEAQVAYLLQTVRLMSEIKVVRRWRRPLANAEVPGKAVRVAAGQKLIGIGASTGGPPVLQTILGGLPKDFAAPILVVQHIARGFLPGLALWLNQTTGLQVHVAAHDAEPLPGHVYFAPDDLHMGVSAGGRILLTREAPESGLRPAVSYLFRSLAAVYRARAVGVLLTGMGRDGAVELRLMRDRGAVTIAQDRETSVVNGMPGAAQALDAATHVMPADKIAALLQSLVGRGTGTTL